MIGIASGTVETTIHPLYWILKFIETQNNSTYHFLPAQRNRFSFFWFLSLSTKILMLVWKGIGRGKQRS